MSSTAALADSYRHCEELARKHYENFPVASFLIPREKRKHVAAIYAFARIADDYADEPGLAPDERLMKLGGWQHQLEEAYTGKASHPVFIALGRTAEEFHIPQHLFTSLLKAFVSDVTVRRYETFGDVLAYCRNSANPVGRLVLLLFGYSDDESAVWSDQICSALQLTNFWQDLSIDIQKDRLYLPLEDLKSFGVRADDLLERRESGAFRNLMEFQVRRTKEMFAAGRPLLGRVGRDFGIELKLTWLGGMRILDKIARSNFSVLNRRPALSPADKALLLVRAVMQTR